MDKLLNSQKDKQTIYDIYRACRLCGAGAGYKMPIIQSVVDVDESEIELKQKIRECVQIEVDQDDKMPPLICELCVDKVNDFYEFLDMCRQTNKKTRLRLGLPPQSMPSGVPDAGDCIFGLTEPVYLNTDEEPKKKTASSKAKINKELKALSVKIEPIKQQATKTQASKTSKSSSTKSRRSPIPPATPPTPPRVTRQKKDDLSLSQLQEQSKPKSILKKERSSSLSLSDDSSLLVPRAKRGREVEIKIETPPKKVKVQPSKPASPKIKIKESKPQRSVSPPKEYRCTICELTCNTSQGLGHHMKTHVVGFTSKKLACNACGEWFSSAEETATHHKNHRGKSIPYSCSRCYSDFKTNNEYELHLDKDCIPWYCVPDVKCYICWHMFATSTLLDDHHCLGVDHRPGGKCRKCKRSYALLKNLQKHESTCTYRKKGELDPDLLAKLKPMQIRLAKCDSLLSNRRGEHYDVSTVSANYGLDPNCFYPYSSIPWRLKDGMVSINDDYVHWDSTSGSDTEGSINLIQQQKRKKIDSLTKLSLKTIFSEKFLGKVPRKRKRNPDVGLFDVILHNDDDYNVNTDIGSIINSLREDEDINFGSAVSESDISVSKNELSISDKRLLKDDEDVSNSHIDDESKFDKNDTVNSIDELSLDNSKVDDTNSITDNHNESVYNSTDNLSYNNESRSNNVDVNGVKDGENSTNFKDSCNPEDNGHFDNTSIKKDNSDNITEDHANNKIENCEENTQNNVSEVTKNTYFDENLESKTVSENSLNEKSIPS